MKTLLFSILLFPCLAHSFVYNKCDNNIDKIQLFFVNGMFTPYEKYRDDINSIDYFQRSYLNDYGYNGPVHGQYNDNEIWYEQIWQVARQKAEDLKQNDLEYQIITDLLNGDMSVTALPSRSLLSEFMEAVFQTTDYSILDDEDYQNALLGIKKNLSYCARTVLVTHSQGNFYGNVLLNEIYNYFLYDNKWDINEYKNLGFMSIANPTNTVGGEFGDINTGLIGHITRDADIIMKIVRTLFGAVEANYAEDNSVFDTTGHGLIDSYLSGDTALIIQKDTYNIVSNMSPVPMLDQKPISSSAISHVGYSVKSQVLDIKFRDSGNGYRYYQVPIAIWNGFNDALSRGRYYNENIKGKYQSKRLMPFQPTM